VLNYRGKYNSANVMLSDAPDETTVKQIYGFLNHPAFKGGYIAIMPDCHAVKGSCIGFTMTLNDYIIPAVVGVDIGCGVLAVDLQTDDLDFEKLDKWIRENVPCGFSTHGDGERNTRSLKRSRRENYVMLAAQTNQPAGRALESLGTLGGGNHFIEVDRAPDGSYWLLVHSGSRNLGLKVAEYHQNEAKKLMKTMFHGDAYRGLEFLPRGHGFEAYLEDMTLAQEYAHVNRLMIASRVWAQFLGRHKGVDGEGLLRLGGEGIVESVHNYIGDDSVIRKGAISAHEGERVLIPLNMRDGVVVAVGKGSQKWNNSAPHGAGRVLSRTQAKKQLTVEDFKVAMEGIWTSSVGPSTLDEAPGAYKPAEVILDVIGETVDVEFTMKPVYNFKAS